jgi:hypothetical protein
MYQEGLKQSKALKEKQKMMQVAQRASLQE